LVSVVKEMYMGVKIWYGVTLCLIVAGLLADLLFAADTGVADTATEQLRAKQDKISAISERLRSFVDTREISGAVTLVATPDRIVYLDAIGKADIGEGTLMEPNTIFWIASMTKPILATLTLPLLSTRSDSTE
jgi:CubicO group peptidase (beta-lactamase class C family)